MIVCVTIHDSILRQFLSEVESQIIWIRATKLLQFQFLYVITCSCNPQPP